MPSTAITSQNTQVRIRTATGTAVTIASATQASPPVITATAHPFTDGDIIRIDSIAGMIELNGRAYVVTSSSTNSFALLGIDATGYSAYTSAGSARALTMNNIGNAKNFSGFDGQAAEIDVTNLISTAKEYRLGLQDFGNVSIDIDLDMADTGQTEARAAKSSGAEREFTITLSDGKVAAFVAFVRQFTVNGSPDGVVSGTMGLRITGEPSFFV